MKFTFYQPVWKLCLYDVNALCPTFLKFASTVVVAVMEKAVAAAFAAQICGQFAVTKFVSVYGPSVL